MIYRQSYIPAHSELTWILDCFSGVGEMSRMTQLREKTRGAMDQVLNGFDKLVDALNSISNRQQIESTPNSFLYDIDKLINIIS